MSQEDEPLAKLRCPVCSGSHVSPATTLRTDGAGRGLRLLFQGPDVSWASTGHEAFTARTARVCLDCGHVMTFFSQTQLAKLRARLSEVTALVPPDDDD